MITEVTALVALRETKKYEKAEIVDTKSKKRETHTVLDAEGKKRIDKEASGKKNAVSTYHTLREPIIFKIKGGQSQSSSSVHPNLVQRKSELQTF